jgi:hypothetical protein
MQFKHWPFAGSLKAPPLCCGCVSVTFAKHFGHRLGMKRATIEFYIDLIRSSIFYFGEFFEICQINDHQIEGSDISQIFSTVSSISSLPAKVSAIDQRRFSRPLFSFTSVKNAL